MLLVERLDDDAPGVRLLDMTGKHAYRALLLILLLRGVCAMPELAARERAWREAERALALAAMGGENFPGAGVDKADKGGYNTP